MRIAFIVQRYGLDVNGGAELHCRLVAEHLASDHQVEVLSSRALDYISWRDHYPAGQEEIGGVLVRRFGVRRPRDERRFGLISEEVFAGPTPTEKQQVWLREQGPYVPSMIDFLKHNADNYDLLIPYSFRYYHSYEAVRLFPHKTILVPTAEPDPAVELSVFHQTFNNCRAILYNTPESMDLIQKAQRNQSVPGLIVGVGIEDRSPGELKEVLKRHSLEDKP